MDGKKTTAQMRNYYNLGLGWIAKNLGLGKHWAIKRWALTYYSNYYGKRVIVKLFETKEEAETLLENSIKTIERLETEIYQDKWDALEAKDEEAIIACDIVMDRIDYCNEFLHGLRVIKLSKEELINE